MIGVSRLVATVFVSAVVLAGCVSSKTVTGPSGGDAHYIRCGAASLDACYDQAGQLCPSGFDVIDSSERGRNTIIVECR